MSNNFWENECCAANRLAVAQSKKIAELEQQLALADKEYCSDAREKDKLHTQLAALKISEETLLRANDLMVAKNREKNEQLEKVTTERVHFEAVAMTAIDENEKLEQQLAKLREGIAAIYGDAVVPEGLSPYEVVKMSPTALIKHCKKLLKQGGK